MSFQKDNPNEIGGAIIAWFDQFSPFGMMTTDENLVVTGWNQWMALHAGMKADEAVGRKLLNLYPDLVGRNVETYFRKALAGQTSLLSHSFHGYLVPMKTTDPRCSLAHMPQAARISPLLARGRVIGTISHIEDITERILREKDLEEQISKLEGAMNQIKTLKGLLPICSYCKKIRDDDGYWNQVEVYVGENTDAEFSHSICPECLKKEFPEFDFDEDD